MARDATAQDDQTVDVDLVIAQFDGLDTDTHRKALVEAARARDVYRTLVDELRAKVAKLEQGLVGPTSQRFKGEDDSQLSLKLLSELLGRTVDDTADAKQLADELARQAEQEAAEPDGAGGGDGGGQDGSASTHRRPNKATGRKTARGDLPKIRVEVLPDEVKRLGLDAFVRIGEQTSTVTERRVSSLVEVTVVRPKFRAKTEAAIDAVRQQRQTAGTLGDVQPEAWITQAAPPALPIERGTVGPSLLANVAVRRFDDHLPYNRLENVYEREGMRLGRSTLYGWLDALRPLFAPLVRAMLADARAAPYLCVDATGVLVRAPDKCKRGHFWVVVAPERHVLFAFSERHDKKAVDRLLGDYEGLLVADAHTVYDHLYGDGATEVGCWGHARAYFFKTMGSEPDIAREFLENLRILFMLERTFADKPRKQRERMRNKRIKPLVDRHFALCRKHDANALDGTPLRAAITYSINQEQALRRFLDDGRLPATNNISERSLRREATGRKNWLFVASTDGAEVNTTFTTLIASCHMHGIEPEAYLRDVMCLLPDWPLSRVIELAPCHWNETRQKPEAQQRLADALLRTVIHELDTHYADLA